MSTINDYCKGPAESKAPYTPQLPYPPRKVQWENQSLEQKQKKKVEGNQYVKKTHIDLIKELVTPKMESDNIIQLDKEATTLVKGCTVFRKREDFQSCLMMIMN